MAERTSEEEAQEESEEVCAGAQSALFAIALAVVEKGQLTEAEVKECFELAGVDEVYYFAKEHSGALDKLAETGEVSLCFELSEEDS